jgi:hypothetical protein
MLACHKRKNTAPGTKEFAIGTKVWRKTEILNVFKIFIQKYLPPHISIKQLHFPRHQNRAYKQIQTSFILYVFLTPVHSHPSLLSAAVSVGTDSESSY